ncbi:hypothetical protein Tco_0077790 [Tanacetum coccineum]
MKSEEYCSDILYAVSIKEDTTYLCLHFIRNHEDLKRYTPYPEDSILRIQDQIHTAYSNPLNTAYRSSDTAAKIIAKMKVIKEGSKKFRLRKINDDSFAGKTPLGTIFNKFNRLIIMDDDLFTYEVEIHVLSSVPSDKKEGDGSSDGDLDVFKPRACYDENDGIYAEAVIFVNKRLVRLMDVTVEQWLDLMYGDHKKVDIKVKEGVISKWLVRSYKKQFDEYIEIKKQWVARRINVDMEYDASDIKFAEWLASKFYNHMTMDQYTKNALWIYWTRGEDEVELTDEEFSDSDDEYLIDKDKFAKIFRIETDIFHFKTPIYKAFDEFNFLLKINTDLLTNGNLKKEALKQKTIYERSWGDATHGVMNFCAWLKRCFGNFHELDYELLVKLEECWWKMNDHECSPFTNWRNHIHKTYANTNINANYNPYLDVSRTFNHDAGRNDEEAIHEERKSNNEHSIRNFDCDLVRDNASYHANDEEYEEDRCELLGNPRQELPVCKIGRFELIKYSFESAEKYITIKEHEHDDWPITKEDACHDYQEIFRIMDEGCLSSQTLDTAYPISMDTTY